MTDKTATPSAPEVDFNVGGVPIEDDFDEANADFGNELDPTPETDQPEEPDETPAEVEEADDGDTPAPEAEEPAPETEQKQQPTIPKSRFDTFNERMKRAERELAELRAAAQDKETPAVPEVDLDELEQKYAEAILDGEVDTARQIRSDIRKAERAEYERVAAEKAQSATSADRQQADLNAAVKTAEEAYPVLDQSSDDYNQDIVDEVVDLMSGWVRTGKYTPAEAMVKAVKTTAKLYDLDAPPPAPEKPAAPKEKVASKEEVRKKVKAAASTPPDLSRAGEGMAREVGLNIDDLSEEEFDALPESKLRELRGDFT